MFRKEHLRFVLLSALGALLLLSASARFAEASAGDATTSLFAKVPSVSSLPNCDPFVAFKASNFSNPTRINNKWLPMIPGTQLTLAGTINVDGKAVSQSVVLSVTDLTKVINGVTTIVLWDADITAGQLAESELAFFAQDNDGNVWNLGEYPEEYENGKFVGAPSTWIAGLADAKAGIHVQSNPQLGTPPYLEGKATNVGFYDCGQVYQKGQSVSVPAGNYSNVLVINEWDPTDPDSGIQRKFYAPNVGPVQVAAVNDPLGETMALSKIKHLCGDALKAVRSEALRLDRRGYKFSNVYSRTAPAARTLQVPGC
jgi:hypothetical protein